jgi:ABC-2 type transport system permease protein
VTRWWAHVRMEVRLTLRRGESLLLTLGIPVGLLVFFTTVHVTPVPAGQRRVDFLTPGILGLAVMSTAFVALSIATGFERSSGVLRRLWVTPLTRRQLVTSKATAIVLLELLQSVVILGVGAALGWHPHGTLTTTLTVVGVVVLASFGFAGIGLVLAGALRAEVNLAAANGLYLVLLLGSGLVLPLHALPTVVQHLALAVPSGALADALHHLFHAGQLPSTGDVIALSVWAVAAPVLAGRAFRLD